VKEPRALGGAPVSISRHGDPSYRCDKIISTGRNNQHVLCSQRLDAYVHIRFQVSRAVGPGSGTPYSRGAREALKPTIRRSASYGSIASSAGFELRQPAPAVGRRLSKPLRDLRVGAADTMSLRAIGLVGARITAVILHPICSKLVAGSQCLEQGGVSLSSRECQSYYRFAPEREHLLVGVAKS